MLGEETDKMRPFLWKIKCTVRAAGDPMQPIAVLWVACLNPSS